MKKLIFTEINERQYSFYYEDDTLIEIDVLKQDNPSLIGQIYVGQVKNILSNINAAFIEYAKGRNGFLPLDDLKWREKALKIGEQLPVQIIKDAVKTKDPVLTTKLSVTGRYCVVQLYDNRIGYSNKLSKERKQYLKKALDERLKLLCAKYQSEVLIPIGIVVRTSAENQSVTEDEIINEVTLLLERLVTVLKKADSRVVYSVLYKAESFPIQKYNHFRQSGIDEMITDQSDVYEQLLEAVKEDGCVRELVRLYEDNKYPLSALYSLTTRLEEALSKRVWLKCGGFLVIEETEALTVIDVNSGKNITGREKEKTFQKVNLEAALECARQMRLRNFNGIIIIDFINCKDNTIFINALKEAIRKDPIKTTFIDITPLGLVELTRQKTTPTLSEKIGVRYEMY